MYIGINSWAREYTALLQYQVLRSSAQATSSTLIPHSFHGKTLPLPTQICLTMNRKIFKNLKKIDSKLCGDE